MPTGPILIVEEIITDESLTANIVLGIFIATFIFRYLRIVVSIGIWHSGRGPLTRTRCVAVA